MENKKDWWVEDWEELYIKYDEDLTCDMIKDFINKTLEENNRRLREEIQTKMKRENLVGKVWDENADGYNSALSDVLELIK